MKEKRSVSETSAIDFYLTVNDPVHQTLANLPEKALLLAVVQRAVADYFSISDKCKVPVRYKLSARKWFLSSSQEPYSFRWICAQFSDDPDMLRREFLRRLRGKGFRADLGLLAGLKGGEGGDD